MDAKSTQKLQQAFNLTQKPAEKGHSWSTHDRACTHCRDRKIRCGREKPQCTNCERDGVECGYYPPGKRVNHIKLLCNNVGSLEDRLSNIEEVLTNLTTLLKADTTKNPLRLQSEEEMVDADVLSSGCCSANGSSFSRPMDRHIFCDQATHTDRYHGPCSPFSLCKEFSGILLAGARASNDILVRSARENQMGSHRISSSEAVEDALGRMCSDAGADEPYDPQADYVPARLPPKPILLMVILQFFEQSDYATDIFVQSSFMRQVERIYSQHTTPVDEAWVICFNTIILLVLGTENTIQGSDPFLLTVRTSLGNSRVLTIPKLVNVQALAILSIAAQKYCSAGLASSIFAQACILAKIMGLHQSHVTQNSFCLEDAEERFKVIRSLYLRDKSLLLSQGSICWLPTFDCTLASTVVQCSARELGYNPRIQLAAIQEEVYRLFYSAESHNQPDMKRKSELARLGENLDRWADAHDIFASTLPASDADLKLDFFATRISAFRESSEENHVRQVISDARASCLLLLMSYGKLDQSMVTRFETIPFLKSPSKRLGKAVDSRTSKGKTTHKEATVNSKIGPGGMKFHSLLETFSISAFLVLVKNILLAVSSSDVLQAEDDINLLEKVCACYQELDVRNQDETYIHKVGRIFSGFLQIAHLLRPHQQLQTPATGTKPGSNTNNQFIRSPIFFGRQQAISDLADLSGPPSHLTLSMSHEGFSAKIPPMTTPEMTTTGTSPTFHTAMESEFSSPWYDSQRQQRFSPPLQQPFSAPGRKRPRLYEADFALDDSDPDPTLLSDFLNATQNVSF